MISLLLLVAAVTAQTPIACVTGTHAPAAAADPSAHAHHVQPQRADGVDVASHVHHAQPQRADGSDVASHVGHAQSGAPHARTSSNDDAETPGNGVPPCAAVARCHTSALPEYAAVAMAESHHTESGWHLLRHQPTEPVPSFPTPPPRAFS
jgi:hypothetical protein